MLDSVAGSPTTKEYRVPESRGRSPFLAVTPAWADFGEIFQGWDWEPVNIEQPTRTTRRLLNLKDELSLNIELLLAGA